MKKASFGRRSSIAGRNTFGGTTFGRQNSFDGNDMRFKLFTILIMQLVLIKYAGTSAGINAVWYPHKFSIFFYRNSCISTC